MTSQGSLLRAIVRGAITVLVLAGAASCDTFATAPTADAGADGGADVTPAEADGAACSSPGWVTDPDTSIMCDGKTSRPATDPNNCGRCGLSCAGEPCVDGHCAAADVASSVSRLLVGSDDRIFFTTQSPGPDGGTGLFDLKSYEDGTTATTLLETSTLPRLAAAVLNEFLYVRLAATIRPFNWSTKQVLSAPLTPPAATDPTLIATTSTSSAVYTRGTPDEVWKYTTDLQQVQSKVSRPDVVEITTSGDDAFVLQSSGAVGAISRVASDAVLAKGLGNAHALKAGPDGYLYFAEGNGIRRVRTTGGTIEPFHVAGSAVASAFPSMALAVDEANAYWVERAETGTFAIRMKPLCNPAGPALTLASQINNVQGVLLTKSRVYWLRDSNLASMRKAR
jgi:hypothetical protein